MTRGKASQNSRNNSGRKPAVEEYRLCNRKQKGGEY